MWWILFLSAAHAINQAYIISIDTPASLQHIGHFINITHVQATTKVNKSTLPLYSQYLLENGRSYHMEVSNIAMIGCYYSHLRVWHMINETSLVLEEDAVLDDDFNTQIDSIINSLHGQHWDVVMLAARRWHLTQGKHKDVNSYTRACETKCTWYGTRGYIVNKEGAQKLIQYQEPIVVQVDAFISLLNMYKNFTMLWAVREVVHQEAWYSSSVWDACIRCYVSQNVLWIFFLITVVLISRQALQKAASNVYA